MNQPPHWDMADTLRLLRKIRRKLGSGTTDHVKYATRIKQVNWDQIAFGVYSAMDCKQHWGMMKAQIKEYKTLQDVIKEAEEWAEPFFCIIGSKMRQRVK